MRCTALSHIEALEVLGIVLELPMISFNPCNCGAQCHKHKQPVFIKWV